MIRPNPANTNVRSRQIDALISPIRMRSGDRPPLPEPEISPNISPTVNKSDSNPFIHNVRKYNISSSAQLMNVNKQRRGILTRADLAEDLLELIRVSPIDEEETEHPPIQLGKELPTILSPRRSMRRFQHAKTMVPEKTKAFDYFSSLQILSEYKSDSFDFKEFFQTSTSTGTRAVYSQLDDFLQTLMASDINQLNDAAVKKEINI